MKGERETGKAAGHFLSFGTVLSAILKGNKVTEKQRERDC